MILKGEDLEEFGPEPFEDGGDTSQAEVDELSKLMTNTGSEVFDEVKSNEEWREARAKAKGEMSDKLRGRMSQWNSGDGLNFIPTAKTFQTLPPGFYEIKFDPSTGIFFTAQSTKTDELLKFPHTNMEKVLEGITKFWDMEEKFRFYGLHHRRGILLWGPAGTGKTSTIRQVVEDVVKRGGVAFKFLHPKMFAEGLRVFRNIQPETPVVVIMEDIDVLIRINVESEILNILDGTEDIHKVVFLATTNHPEVLGPRIVNRPSRFDRRYKVPEPTPEAREMYLAHLLKGEQKKLKVNLKKWVKDTEGMSLAHLKELFVGVHILGDPYDEMLKTLKEMKEKIKGEGDGGSKMGF